MLNAGGRPPDGEPARGQGLRGMAERVALYDGQFEAGWVDDGYRVNARFPFDFDEAEPTRADA